MPPGSIAISGADSKQMLELGCTVGRAQRKCVAFIDSGTLQCFLWATVASAAGLVLDTSQYLQVCMADGELCTSQGLAHNVHVEFAPDVVQLWYFWVVPLAMDAILGLPWLRGVRPAINWQTLSMVWEHECDVVWV